MDRDTFIALIESSYFGNVRTGNIDAVMACFADSAGVIIRHGDSPERRFGVQPSAGQTELRAFYEHLCGNYDAWFCDFMHYIDTTEQRAASLMRLSLLAPVGSTAPAT
jgi:hypothetical protein